MKDQSIAIVGFGNQAKVWAENFIDSGWNVTFLLRENSPSIEKAKSRGFKVQSLKCLDQHQRVAILISDHEMPHFFKDNAFKTGSEVIFAHGSMLHYHSDLLPKKVSLFLLSPKMIADEVRACYLQKKALPCVLDVFYSETEKSQDLKTLKNLAQALGCTPSNMLFYDAATEVKADFFSEQVVLCGGVPKLLMMAVQTMVDHGIPKDLAFLECVKELEIFMRLFNTKGFYPTMQGISPSAMHGSAHFVKNLMPEKTLKKNLETCMRDIDSGAFYQDLQASSQLGLPLAETWKKEMETSLLNELCTEMLQPLKKESADKENAK